MGPKGHITDRNIVIVRLSTLMQRLGRKDMSVLQVYRPNTGLEVFDWDVFRVFLAVARTSSITAAAAQLNTSQPTVSRRIRELDGKVGTRLLERSVSGVILTPAGHEVFERAHRMEHEAFALSASSLGEDKKITGKVTLTAPEGLGARVLPKIVNEFVVKYPEVDITLLLGPSKVNLLNREADSAIRVGDPGRSTLIGTRIKEVRFGLVASKDYLRNLASHYVVDPWPNTASSTDLGDSPIRLSRMNWLT